MKTSTALLIGGGLVGAALLYRFMQSRSAGTVTDYVPPVVQNKPVLPVRNKPVVDEELIPLVPIRTMPVNDEPLIPIYQKPRIETGTRDLIDYSGTHDMPMLYGAN